MRVGVMGAGGVGGYFGGMLARAGHEVVLIARGQHLEVIGSRGLTVASQRPDPFMVKPRATADPSQQAPVDLLLFSVKTYQNRPAISAIQPLVGEETLILCLQNGVESHQQLADSFGETRVLPGAAYIESCIQSPGVIQQKGDVVRIVFGGSPGLSVERPRLILQTLREAGIEAEIAPDISKALWSKFVFIVTLAGPTSAARAEMSQLLEYSEGRELVISALLEAEAVGRALGVALEPDLFEKTMAYLEGYARHLHASMHTDLEQGRPLELEALTGTVVRLGRRLEVPVPTNRCLYSLLLPHVQGQAQERPVAESSSPPRST